MIVSKEELKKVKTALNNEKNVRIFKRYISLLLCPLGKICGEVSYIFLITI